MTPKEVYEGLVIAEQLILANSQPRQSATALEAIRTALRHLAPFSK